MKILIKLTLIILCLIKSHMAFSQSIHYPLSKEYYGVRGERIFVLSDNDDDPNDFSNKRIFHYDNRYSHNEPPEFTNNRFDQPESAVVLKDGINLSHLPDESEEFFGLSGFKGSSTPYDSNNYAYTICFWINFSNDFLNTSEIRISPYKVSEFLYDDNGNIELPYHTLGSRIDFNSDSSGFNSADFSLIAFSDHPIFMEINYTYNLVEHKKILTNISEDDWFFFAVSTDLFFVNTFVGKYNKSTGSYEELSKSFYGIGTFYQKLNNDTEIGLLNITGPSVIVPIDKSFAMSDFMVTRRALTFDEIDAKYRQSDFPAPPSLFDPADGSPAVSEGEAIDAMVSADGQCKFYQVPDKGYELYHYTNKGESVFSTGNEHFSSVLIENQASLGTIHGLEVHHTNYDGEGQHKGIWRGFGEGSYQEEPYTMYLYSKPELEDLIANDGFMATRDLIAEDDDGCVLVGISDNTNNHVNWSDEDGGEAYLEEDLFEKGSNWDNNQREFGKFYDGNYNPKLQIGLISTDGKCLYDIDTNYGGWALYHYSDKSNPVYETVSYKDFDDMVLLPNGFPPLEYQTFPVDGNRVKRTDLNILVFNSPQTRVHPTYSPNSGMHRPYFLFLLSRDEVLAAYKANTDLILDETPNISEYYSMPPATLERLLYGEDNFKDNNRVEGDDDGCILVSYSDLKSATYPNGLDHYTWTDEAISEAVNTSTLLASSKLPANEATTILLIPNPASDVVNIAYDSPKGGDTTIGIYNLAGVELMSNKYNAAKGANTQSLDISALVRGIYIVKVIGGGVDSSTQLAIQRE